KSSSILGTKSGIGSKTVSLPTFLVGFSFRTLYLRTLLAISAEKGVYSLAGYFSFILVRMVSNFSWVKASSSSLFKDKTKVLLRANILAFKLVGLAIPGKSVGKPAISSFLYSSGKDLKVILAGSLILANIFK